MAATNNFENFRVSLDDPASRAESVTPSDGSELTYVARSLYVGGAGDAVVVTSGGDEVTFSDVPAGMILPVMVKQVKSTGTTATNIVGIR